MMTIPETYVMLSIVFTSFLVVMAGIGIIGFAALVVADQLDQRAQRHILDEYDPYEKDTEQ